MTLNSIPRDCSKFLSTPIISGTGNLSVTFTVCEQKHIKNFGEMGVWAYPGTAQSFKVQYPVLSQERVKLQTSNLADTIIGSV